MLKEDRILFTGDSINHHLWMQLDGCPSMGDYVKELDKEQSSMAQRTEAIYNGKSIGIESIYTVIGDKQINIPEKLNWLREKSKKGELFCPCGCGANLILVAGDRNLREQHFRIKDSDTELECTAVTEGKTSIESKIVLKCWLDDKATVQISIPHRESNANRYDPTVCPECGSRLVERNGRNGRFVGCSSYPRCKYTRSIR